MSKTFFSFHDTEAMPVFEALRRIKRLRLFEPSLGVLGFSAVAAFVILSFFCLDYRDFDGRFGFSGRSRRILPWVHMNGSEQEQRVEFLEEKGGDCDLFTGSWVWDENYPLYQSNNCSFLDQGFRCSENGRPDLFYTKWRWQPRDCNLPSIVSYLRKRENERK